MPPNFFDQFDAHAAPATTSGAPMVGPTPVGTVNALDANKEMTSGATKVSNEALESAHDSLQSLPELEKYYDLAKKSPDNAWGTWEGGDTVNRARAIYAGITSQKPDGDNSSSLNDWHEALNQQRASVALPQIKRLIGSVPRTGGSGGGERSGGLWGLVMGNPEQGPASQALSSVPGTESTSKDSALQGIDRLREQHYNNIITGINMGRIDPKQSLPTAAKAQPNFKDGKGSIVDMNGGEIRPGAAYIAPDNSIRRMPLGTPAGAK